MEAFKSIRPLDYVLAALLVAAAVVIGLFNVNAGADVGVAHALDSHSGWMPLVFAIAVVPILFRRTNALAALAVSATVIAASVPMFGWVTRCGFALPLSFALAYAIARFVDKRLQVLGLLGIAALQYLTLVRDASTNGISPIVGAFPIALIFYGVGLMVQNRGDKHAGQVAPAERVHV